MNSEYEQCSILVRVVCLEAIGEQLSECTRFFRLSPQELLDECVTLLDGGHSRPQLLGEFAPDDAINSGIATNGGATRY